MPGAFAVKRIVNVHEAKTRLSALMAAVEAGERVVIARDGKSAVELVPHREAAIGRTAGVLATDPAWRDWKYDPAVFAPLGTDEELETHGWPT
jgi:antitoxin (DNA-binding transcriptional repressor) of toxin-antitoxin stability system